MATTQVIPVTTNNSNTIDEHKIFPLKVNPKGPQSPDGASARYESDNSPALINKHQAPSRLVTTTTPAPTIQVTQVPTQEASIKPPTKAIIHPPVWSGATSLEWEIHQAQVKNHNETQRARDQEETASIYNAEQLKLHESLLQELQTELDKKQELISSTNEQMVQFRQDLDESLKQLVPSSSTAQKSAAVRMQEQQEKKKLLAEWRQNNSEEPLHLLRRNVLALQAEVAELIVRITNTKKEIENFKRLLSSSVSSHQIMRDERRKREDMATKGIARPKAEAKPEQPPPPPVLRSHQTRLAEQQALKAKRRAEKRLPTASSSSSKPIHAN